MTSPTANALVPEQPRLWIRLALGLLSGLAIVALGKSGLEKSAPMAFYTLIPLLLFIPVLAIGALGQMRLLPMLIWTAITAAFVAALAYYDAGRLMQVEYSDGAPKPTLTPAFFIATPAALYIAHHLIAAADRDRRLIAKYDTYFDIGWTSLVQILLAGGLCLALSLVLLLARGLFDMIGLNQVGQFLFDEWVYTPLMGATFAAGIHLSDVRANLSRGIRTLVLTLLGWLFPVMAALALLFVVSVAFTGVAPIFDTGFASGLLLTAAFALTILMNAAYQDGGEDRAKGPVFTVARYAGCIALFVVVCIAMIAIGQRIVQYGLTPERIFVSVALSLAALYAAGYAIGLLPRIGGVKRIEHTNLIGALALIGAFSALFSPIADPARLSVNSQVKRLEAGLVKAEGFDFEFLQREAGRFGRDALQQLTQAKDTETARLAGIYLRNEEAGLTAGIATLAQRIRVYPQGKTLPDSLINAVDALSQERDQTRVDETRLWSVGCLTQRDGRCDAHLLDLDTDGKDEIIFGNVVYEGQSETFYPGLYWQVIAEGDKGWRLIGEIGPICTPAQVEALKRGELKPSTPLFPDFDVAAGRLHVRLNDMLMPRCS